MIYTITFNPAVDYVVHATAMEIGGMNRSDREDIYVGGKGINVSIVLHELGIQSKALGFVAGFTGEAIESGIRAQGIVTDFVHLKKGFSRINVKIKSDRETELNGEGPAIGDNEVHELFEKLGRVEDGDIVVLAGSIPRTLPANMYERILEYLSDRKVDAVVDATKDLMLPVLKYRPFLIKPNQYELGELFGVTLTTKEEAAIYAAKLREMGARNVLVSMAENGALLLDENGKTHVCRACQGDARNSVGAGDSMVAGFIAGCQEGGYEYALRLGTAAGGATAFSDGLASRDDIYRLLEQLL